MKKLILILFLIKTELLASIAVYSSEAYGFIYNMPIKGLYYKGANGTNIKCTDNTNPTGTTDEDGAFLLNKECKYYYFYLNDNYDISLANISTVNIQKLAANHDNKNIIFLTDLVGANTNDSTNSSAKKLTQLFMSLDNDLNPNNGIDLNTSNTTNIMVNQLPSDILSYTQDDLQFIIDTQYGKTGTTSNRDLFTSQCATSYLEYILNNNPFVSYSTPIDTVGPCTPTLAYTQLATANNQTYVEVLGEAGSEIILNGVKTGKILSLRDSDLYPTGIYEALELDTSIVYDTFDEFNISLIDTKNQLSEDQLEIKIFNDTDQPYFGDINTDIILSSSSAQDIIDLNISDSSKDNGLNLIYELNDTRFDFNETDEILSYPGGLSSGTYSIKLKVKDEAWHREEKVFNITIP